MYSMYVFIYVLMHMRKYENKTSLPDIPENLIL